MLCWQCQIHNVWPSNKVPEFSLSQKDIDRLWDYRDYSIPAYSRRGGEYKKDFMAGLLEGNYHFYLSNAMWEGMNKNLIEKEASLEVLAVWDFLLQEKEKGFPEELTRRETWLALQKCFEKRWYGIAKAAQPKDCKPKQQIQKRQKPKTKQKAAQELKGHFNTYILGA